MSLPCSQASWTVWPNTHATITVGYNACGDADHCADQLPGRHRVTHTGHQQVVAQHVPVSQALTTMLITTPHGHIPRMLFAVWGFWGQVPKLTTTGPSATQQPHCTHCCLNNSIHPQEAMAWPSCITASFAASMANLSASLAPSLVPYTPAFLSCGGGGGHGRGSNMRQSTIHTGVRAELIFTASNVWAHTHHVLQPNTRLSALSA